MDISVERERQQQRSTDRLRELAMKNRGVREDVERNRVADLRDRAVDRSFIPERGMAERERVPERPVMIERPMLVDRDPKAVVLIGRMLDRECRAMEREVHRDVPHGGERGGPLERLRGHGNREMEEERTLEIREPERDIAGSERIVDRDAEREESMRELVSSYKSALAELTFNSKPIITNLTIIAGENSHAAKGISSTVFNHIIEVPKEQKLPSLYLLDSIVKNIGGDYIKYFAARLPEVFCMAYRQVDPSTNPAMQHLFRTWRGVFPQGPLRLIENELQISASAPNGPSGITPPARPVENALPQSGHESPMPRPGHGIHVNPKYLEAQRQRLQRGGQAETVATESNGTSAAHAMEGSNLREGSKGWLDTQLKRPPMPSRGKRGEYRDPGFVGVTSFDLEYDDYGPSNGLSNGRRPAPGRISDREEGWESGYFQERDGDGFGHEESRGLSGRYGERNGYDWRQPARSTDLDSYAFNRGPGPGRGDPFSPVQALPDSMEVRGRGGLDNWLKTDEEEYNWEDMSPRLRPPPARDDTRTGDRLSKDDWYPESARNMLGGDSGCLKRTSQDAGFGDNSSWRRNGPGLPMEHSHPGSDRLLPKEYDDRRSMKSAAGRESGIAARDQIPAPVRGSLSGPRPNWLSQGSNLRNLSPPARTRSGAPLLSVSNNNSSPTTRSSQNLIPCAGTPPTLSNGGAPPLNSSHFESRQISRSNVGNFGEGSPTYNTLSPVTPPVGLAFQQRQQSHRHPPSPTQLSRQGSHQHIPPLTSIQSQNQQPHLQFQHEQSSHLQVRHPMHISGQLQSSQPLPQAPQGLQQGQAPSQGVPPMLQSGQQSLQHTLHHLPPQQGQGLQPGSQVPALQQSQQQPARHQAHQVPVQQPLSQLHQSQTKLQQPTHPFPATLLPLISSQLALSLQQLAQQGAQKSQQSQALSSQQQPQSSQLLNALPQTLTQAVNGPSSGSLQGSENQSPNHNLLAAFLQSGLIPPAETAHILPQSLPMSSRRLTTSLQPTPSQSTFQGQPPLPNGPPPAQFPNTIGTAPPVEAGVPGQMGAAVATTINQMTTYGGQPQRYSQPPLPPGPPPASTVVGSSSTMSSVSSALGLSNSISSLLSSLVAHGVIAAPAPTAFNPCVPLGAAQQPTLLGGFVSGGPLPSTSVGASPTTGSPTTAIAVPPPYSPPNGTTQDIPHSPCNSKKMTTGVEFKQEFLRERHEYVLEALYSDFPRQCKTCGLRFKAQDEHSKHMDWHVSRNRRQKSQKKLSRKWFMSAKEWLSGTSAAAAAVAAEFAQSFFAKEPGVQEENTELVAVPADENQSACALCGELFEDFYSDETDEWMYKGAVYLNTPQGMSTEGLVSSALGPIVHMKCRTESAKTAALDYIEEEEEEEEEEELELQAEESVKMEVDGMGEDNIIPLPTDNFDMSESKEEQEDLGSRRKRTRY